MEGDGAVVSEEAAQRASIQYTLEAPHELKHSVLEEEREKHRRRAAKFGTEFKEPSKVRRDDRALVIEARKERLARPGFTTGIDVFADEEVQKRASRAARFGVVEPKGLQYVPDQEEVAKARRAKKFGVEYTGTDGAMMDMDLFESRAEVSKDIERRPDAIYLYGVDIMSTGDCLAYFGDYGPTFVEWINDSSCVVTFNDKFSAARAIAATGHPLPNEEMTGESSAGLDAAEPSNMPYFWHKGKDFTKNGAPVHLIYRMACVTDIKDPNAPRKTRELWKVNQSTHGGQRGKSRRTRVDQGAGERVRVDEDGDVDMEGGDGEGGGRGGKGRGRRERRRKSRNADGGVSVMMDIEGGEDVDPQGEGVQHELDPYEGRMDGGDGGQRAPTSLLRRMIRAKRAGPTSEPDIHHEGEPGLPDNGGDVPGGGVDIAPPPQDLGNGTSTGPEPHPVDAGIES